MRSATNGYAVIDVETTGLRNSDRIIEIAVVSLDNQFRVVDEYDTLVDPKRDVGPTDIHGITPTMLSMAPVFGEIAGVLARRIVNKSLVAHNVPFENRMLVSEFQRLGASMDPGDGICTLRHTREKLPTACRKYGVEPPHHHRALSDARATAELLRAIGPDQLSRPIVVNDLSAPMNPRTHRRGADGTSTALERLLSRTTYAEIDPRHLAYIDILDWALDDFLITDDERQQLQLVAAELNLDPSQIAQAHQEYFNGMLRGAERDGVITIEENRCLGMVAHALALPPGCVPAVTETAPSLDVIQPGASVCITGGSRDRKRELKELAISVGLKVVSSVTKKRCDFVVAADPNSSSGKAQKARAYGKPLFSVEQFVSFVNNENAI